MLDDNLAEAFGLFEQQGRINDFSYSVFQDAFFTKFFDGYSDRQIVDYLRHYLGR